MSLRENILPGLTTLHIWPSLPIRDFSSRLVHVLRLYHLFREIVVSSSFSSGTSMVILRELITMPRYVRRVEGPSILSSARGMFKSWKACMMLSSWAIACAICVSRTAKKSSE